MAQASSIREKKKSGNASFDATMHLPNSFGHCDQSFINDTGSYTCIIRSITLRKSYGQYGVGTIDGPICNIYVCFAMKDTMCPIKWILLVINSWRDTLAFVNWLAVP